MGFKYQPEDGGFCPECDHDGAGNSDPPAWFWFWFLVGDRKNPGCWSEKNRGNEAEDEEEEPEDANVEEDKEEDKERNGDCREANWEL